LSTGLAQRDRHASQQFEHRWSAIVFRASLECDRLAPRHYHFHAGLDRIAPKARKHG
jgi:hypothetical protein